jgi:hypothetical protein
VAAAPAAEETAEYGEGEPFGMRLEALAAAAQAAGGAAVLERPRWPGKVGPDCLAVISDMFRC